MGKVIVLEYVSLDGVIQAPGHAGEDDAGGFAHGGWTGPWMADHRRYVEELFATADAFLLGRRTYQIFAAYWPTVTDERDTIAVALNTRPKHVVSTTLSSASWANTQLIDGSDLVHRVRELRTSPGGPIIVIGSSLLVQLLARQDLVDEYRLMVHPVVVGSGKRLFPEGTGRFGLDLIDARTTTSGLVVASYRPARSGAT